jgi:hypothetical protein
VLNTSADSLGINQRAHYGIDQFAFSTAVPCSTIRPAIFSASLLAAAREERASRTWGAEVTRDLGRVFDLLVQGVITPQIARQLPLTDAAAAARYAEAGASPARSSSSPTKIQANDAKARSCLGGDPGPTRRATTRAPADMPVRTVWMSPAMRFGVGQVGDKHVVRASRRSSYGPGSRAV